MQKPSLIKQLLLGLLLGIFLLPAQPAQAQWTVFDPTSYAAQIEEMAREVDRWMSTIQHYTAMYDKAVQQVTSLGGILTIVDKQLARNKELVASVASIGQTVRHIYQLKRQIENMVQCRIRAIQQLDSRLKAGIFNPQQDLQDLEEYLRNSIGRASQDTLANLERLANMDNEFERMRYELQNAYGRLAEAQAVLKQYEEMLTTEMAKPDNERHSLALIQTQISNTKIQIEQIKAQITDLTEKLAAKTKQYGIELQTRGQYGQQVHQTNQAWESTIPVRKEILDQIDKTFEPDEGIDDDPADGNN
jgi:DNA repair exonuclease SbcCD ATPase subunit